MADAADKAADGLPAQRSGVTGAAADASGEAPAGSASNSSPRREAIRVGLYILFAAIAMLVNIGTQEAVLQFAPFVALYLSIIAGTATGFIVKYWLDKNWIFYDVTSGLGDEAAKIVTYGLFGLLITSVFWVFELVAWWAFETSAAKYAGAAAGLSIGYAIKYKLDKSFVFTGRRR
jgi:putative flippase GtrA